MDNNLKATIRFLEQYRIFFILGHTEPDGDCIGSQLAMASFLSRMGKRAIALQTGPFDRPESTGYSGAFTAEIPAGPNTGINPVAGIFPAESAVIVVDCSTPDRVDKSYHGLFKLPILVMDHHASGEPFGTVRFADPSAASTTILVYRLAHSMGISLSKDEAELLFFGLATDTGYFRHCEETSCEVFRTAADLVCLGVSPRRIHREMYGNREFRHRQFLGLLLTRAETFFNGKYIYTWQSLADAPLIAGSGRSSDELFGLLQTIRGVEVIALVREEASGVCSVGLRSRETVDVGALAGRYGGGGHKLAAGFNAQDTRDGVRALLLEALAPLLTEPSPA